MLSEVSKFINYTDIKLIRQVNSLLSSLPAQCLVYSFMGIFTLINATYISFIYAVQCLYIISIVFNLKTKNITSHRKMELLYQKFCSLLCFHAYLIGILLGPVISIYIIFFTRFWWLLLIYMAWIYFYDFKVSEEGGRRWKFVRSLRIWDVCIKYYNYTIQFESGVNFDSDKNYVFACFPHGILPISLFFLTVVQRFADKYFPQHKLHLIILHGLFYIPLYREYILSVGFCSSSSKSIRWLLNKPEGGNIAVIAVGGARESYFCRPGDYHIILKNRKGFIKLALESGSPIVPVFNFGEHETFKQLKTSESVRKIQETIRKYVGFAFPIPIGCGFFQDYFGIIPRQARLTTVVGKPINVEKTEHPTAEQINDVHDQFTNRIMELFENNKHKYLKNAESTSLIIE